MRRQWHPSAVLQKRNFRRRFGPMFDGHRINNIAAYISVFAATSALFVAGLLTHQCSNDWPDEFSGIFFIVLGVGLWICRALFISQSLGSLSFLKMRLSSRSRSFSWARSKSLSDTTSVSRCAATHFFNVDRPTPKSSFDGLIPCEYHQRSRADQNLSKAN